MRTRFINDAIDGVKNYGSQLIDNIGGSTFDNNYTGPAHPDLTRFMQAVNAEDLSRPNLFLVRFGNIGTHINADGTFDFVKLNESQSSNYDYEFGKVKDLGMNIAMGTEIGKTILGAYNPEILRTLLPGEFINSVLPSGFDINKDLAMLVKAASLPGISFDTNKSFHDRKPMTSVVGRDNDTISMTFYMTSTQKERGVITAWMNAVHNENTNEFGFYDSYSKEIEIYPLTRQGVPMSVVACKKAFPVKISEVKMDTDSNNQVNTFDVEFTFSTMETRAFQGKSPFTDNISSIAENVFTSAGAFR